MRHLLSWKLILVAALMVAPASSAQAHFSQLNQGQTLWTNQSLWDPWGNFELRIQGDCNLVLYKHGTALWASNTANWSWGCRADMQWDGNFVVHDAYGRVIWAANSVGGSYLRLYTDGGLAVFRWNGDISWFTQGYIADTGVFAWSLYTGQIYAGTTLRGGDVLKSYSGTDFTGYRLVMQSDCNLVLYSLQFYRGRNYWIDFLGTLTTLLEGQNIPIFASNTHWYWSDCRAVFQYDGNLVLYDPNNRVLWASNTAGRGGYTLRAQDDGNLVIYDSWNRPLWSTGTVNLVGR